MRLGKICRELVAAALCVVPALAASPAREASRAATGKSGIEWVRIPGGKFMMGSGDYLNAQPHRVTIKTFHLAKTLVTNKQYKACVEAGACSAPDSSCFSSAFQGDDQPVVCVDWNQARAYCLWAGGRLPSEAEWEYAARSAGKDWKYPWGNEEASCERAVMDVEGNGCGRSATWPVCSKPAGNTRQGLCDMAGNALEWTADWYHDSYDGAPNDGGAWESPEGSYRVIRGGSWYYGAGNARAAFRTGSGPGNRNDSLGFRVAR